MLDQSSSGFSYPFSHLFARELSPSKANRKTAFTPQFSFACLPYGNSAVFTQTEQISESKHRIVAQAKTYVSCLDLIFVELCHPVFFIANKIILIDTTYALHSVNVVKRYIPGIPVR